MKRGEKELGLRNPSKEKQVANKESRSDIEARHTVKRKERRFKLIAPAELGDFQLARAALLYRTLRKLTAKVILQSS